MRYRERFAAALALAALAACGPEGATAELCNGLDDDLDGRLDESGTPATLRVTVGSDIAVPAPLAEVRVTARAAGSDGEPVSVPLRSEGSSGPGTTLPISVDLAAPRASVVDVVVEGYEAGGSSPIVSRIVRLRAIVPGTRIVPITLETSCLDVECGVGLTCDRGACGAIEPREGDELVSTDEEMDRVAARLDCQEESLCSEGACVVEVRLGASPVQGLDLLFVVDNSNSMNGEQGLLGLEIPWLVESLASGDLDRDGVADFPGVRSLHVGVVTPDMGAGPILPAGQPLPTCDPGLGDDGILRTVAGPTAGCAASYPPVFEFVGDDPAEFAIDVGCVAVTGVGGCGFEQQLEAMLKALSPAAPASWVSPEYEPPIFAGGGGGHGDGANAGFLREGSLLAVVILSDEEDCSVPDYSLFYQGTGYDSIQLNLRCFAFPEQLYSIDRYALGLARLRRNPAHILFVPIVGIPIEMAASSAAGFDAILADPRMIETPDPSTSPSTRLLSTCTTADGGAAFPGRRYVALARDLVSLGASARVESICAPTFRPAVDEIARAVGAVVGGSCLPRALPMDAGGRSTCRIIEVLPPGTSCVGRASRIPLDVVRENDLFVHRCEVRQVDPGAGSGWSLVPDPQCSGMRLVTPDDLAADARLVCPE